MTNAQILTAVILKWGEPVIPVMMGNTLNGISAGMLPVEKLFKSIGLAGPGWQISNEINSLAAVGGTKLIRPFLEKFVSRIPDDMIPELAHGYVDSAIQKGKLSVIDGDDSCYGYRRGCPRRIADECHAQFGDEYEAYAGE